MPSLFTKLTYLASPDLLRPAHRALLVNDFSKKKIQTKSLDWHIEQSVKWIIASWEATGRKGSSAGYSLVQQWRPAYPETSGYIIPTLWKYVHISENQELKELAKACAISLTDWETEIQLSNGAVRGGVYGKDKLNVFKSTEVPVVFNTGMVVFGWAASYKETKDERYLEAMIKAANWLVSVQEPNGSWIKGRSESTDSELYSYYTMVAWAQAEAFLVTGNKDFELSCKKFLDWAISVQQPNGAYQYMAFNKNQPAFLHTIAYTIQGMLEAGILLKEEKYIQSANQAAAVLNDLYKKDNTLWGTYTESWTPDKSFKCLTGMVQMAICYYKLYTINHSQEYASIFAALNRQVQELTVVSDEKGLNGGIRGSFPVWGSYSRMNFPNWAAKFYLDALFLEKEMCGC